MDFTMRSVAHFILITGWSLLLELFDLQPTLQGKYKMRWPENGYLLHQRICAEENTYISWKPRP